MEDGDDLVLRQSDILEIITQILILQIIDEMSQENQ
jgi:hypothetical protein